MHPQGEQRKKLAPQALAPVHDDGAWVGIDKSFGVQLGIELFDSGGAVSASSPPGRAGGRIRYILFAS
ncbi:unnamed protein product [Penicillium salamii]|nr:unnamed protein product [Penicillium salamii]CAG8315633.1 unnamed protein product [Penicillium salamii]